MRSLLLYVSLFIFSHISNSQNLIRNPSFEERTGCPTNINQLNFCKDWERTINSSVDYFHMCTNSINRNGIPQNVFGFQYPKTDSAYVGLGLYTNLIENAREYISQEFSFPLIKDINYKLKLNISLSDDSRFAISNLGAYLSENKILSSCGNGSVLNCLLRDVQLFESGFLVDTVDWLELSLIYKASGGEKFLILGYFKDDDNADYLLFNNQAINSSAYYYIDDVSLVRVFNKDLGVELEQLGALCPKPDENIRIRFKNEGVDSLDFSSNPVSYTAEVSVNTSILQSVSAVISDNSLNHGGLPLAPDSSFSISFGPIDFTQVNQDYRIQVTANLPGDEQLSNNVIDTLISFQISLGNSSVSESIVCFGNTVFLEATNFKGKPKWQISSDGSNWQSLSNEASLFHLPQTSTFYRFSVCDLLFSDIYRVEVQNPSLENASMKICLAGEYLLSPEFSADVQKVNWFASENDTLAFHNGFQYSTQLIRDTVFYLEMEASFCTSERQAYEISFGECLLEIPNIFSPNGDGINDVFLYGNAEGKIIETKIFNRWGEKIQEWNGNSGWDGHGVNDGVYYYLIKADGEVFKGTVTLVR